MCHGMDPQSQNVSCYELTIAELLEKRNTGGNSDSGGSFPGVSGVSVTLKLNSDDALSDLADSDSEVRAHGNSTLAVVLAVLVFVRNINR